MSKKLFTFLGLLRLAMGWLFLWAFLDKLFGFGFSTPRNLAWINGGSPTSGFLKGAVTGPLSGFYHSLAGSSLVDWLFMMGLFFVGICLVLGIFVRFASLIGVTLLSLMYLALIPPKNNPILDDHIIYILVMLVLYFGESGRFLGLGSWWNNLPLVQKYSIFKNIEIENN
jgi:thiosulfate dehydrogenase [quinone] large subunit